MTTILLTKQEDIEVVREILQEYAEASGAEINIHKSKALALGGWVSTCDTQQRKLQRRDGRY
jgi:hypothetical protein